MELKPLNITSDKTILIGGAKMDKKQKKEKLYAIEKKLELLKKIELQKAKIETEKSELYKLIATLEEFNDKHGLRTPSLFELME